MQPSKKSTHIKLALCMLAFQISMQEAIILPYPPSIKNSHPNATTYEPSFTLTDITTQPFTKLSSNVPATSCPVQSVQYQTVIKAENGVYRVPHSRILMNGMQCGPLSETATEDDLYKDSYMELMPIDFLLDEDKAEEKNTLAAYHRLTSTRQETRSFYNFSRHEFITHGKAARTWVGFERFATRTCGKGDKSVQLSQNSFVFFGKYDNVVLNVTGLMERNKGHEVIIREETPFHVTFSEASISNKEDSAEHVCPFVRPVRRIVPKGEVRMCFPAGVVVEVSDGRRVQMNKLKIGDRIRDGTNGYSEVFMFSHRDSSSFRNEFVKLKTARGASVTLSRGHLLRTRGGLRSAGEMRVGEGVMTSGKEDEDVIVWKGLVYEDGLYNPHTISGEFIVNGIVVSCYTTAVWPITAHALLAPLRAAYIVGRLLPKLREVGGGLRRVGLRQMVDIAKISTF